MQNPLDAEINLSNVTLLVVETDNLKSGSLDDAIDVEVIKEATLGPKASISVSVCTVIYFSPLLTL
jgi:hypothetical protein